MSGGSWDYFYLKLEDVALRLINSSYASQGELRVKLGRLLADAAVALQAIEWVDSMDYSKGDEREALLKVLKNRY